jgi:4-amino-4-deoxy-L-arabinose transferase-like glycosyltransferase
VPALASRATIARIPRAAWLCALVACLNAVCWSILTPPFEVTDEPDHFAYVKQLAETGTLPSSSSETVSAEEITVLKALRYFQVRQEPQTRAIASAREQEELRAALRQASEDAKAGSPAAGVAALEPPLYYALEAIPYRLALGGSLLDRLQLMRLFSAVFAGLTALFTFLFVREALPRDPWAWLVGGLAGALAPLLGFMSGSVNPDSLLFAISAASFYVLALAFRRGLDARRAIAIGSLTALGLLTKVNFVGLVPGILVGIAALSARAARTSGPHAAARILALSVGIALSPLALYVIVNLTSGKPALGVVSTALASTRGSVVSEANYIWQLYLPRLPGTVDDFPGLFTPLQLWFNGYVGLYGWLDTTFPAWVDTLALLPAGALVLLCARSLSRGRPALRRRRTELAVYAAMTLGLLALIGADSYRSFPSLDAEYAQARYLLPLLPLLCAALALAARGAGRRWGPATGALIVVLFLGHDILSQLQMAARFYG